MTLLKIFKSYFNKQYNSIINDSLTTIPLIISRIFIERRQAFVPTTNIAPNTIRILQTMNHQEICDYFIECLMLPLMPDRISNTISLIRTKAFVQFKFLVEIFKLEIFIRSDKLEITLQIFELYNNFVEEFLAEPTEQTIPNIENFITYLLRLEIDKNIVTRLKVAYIVFVQLDSSVAKIHQFEKRINSFILAFYETIETMDIFEIQRVKTDPLDFEKPFVVLKQEILDEIKQIQKIKTREQAWPSLLPLND